MTIESKFDITSAQISEIGLYLRKEDPDYIWGTYEYHNAIFEMLIIANNLPWDSDLGGPDWENQQVKDLNRELSDFFKREDEVGIIEGVEARCNTNECDWNTEGQVVFDQADRVLRECELTGKCRGHHRSFGVHVDHNRFSLYSKNKHVGQASVSSQVCTGYVDLIKEDSDQ